MIYIYYFLCVLTGIFIIFDCYLIIKFIEYICCANIIKQPPLVSSNKKLRKAVISHINKHYKNSKNICEIGSGFGGLARYVARNTNANVYALENMPFSAFVSKSADILSFCKNNKTIWCDAFKYLDNTDIKFDIAIAYLGPTLTSKIYKYRNKIDVLISLDFKIPGITPKRVINVCDGYTIYKKIKYPHRLYIYEF